MAITCFIRYEIDPFKRDAFAEYSRTWGQAVPAAGADLIGYFGPHEGSATTAYGIYSVDSLAAYEAYRTRLAASDLGKQKLRLRSTRALHSARGSNIPDQSLDPTRRKGNDMIAVIFEVEPNEGKLTPYLDMAADLKPILEDVDGFISVERFQSLTTEGKYLSISFWRDEDALLAWRRHAHHRRAQHSGRHEMFADYRLRVASVLRDYGMFERDQAPADAIDK